MVVALAAVRCRMSLVRFALRVPTSHTTELTVIRHSDTPVTAVWTNRTVAVSGQTADRESRSVPDLAAEAAACAGLQARPVAIAAAAHSPVECTRSGRVLIDTTHIENHLRSIKFNLRRCVSNPRESSYHTTTGGTVHGTLEGVDIRHGKRPASANALAGVEDRASARRARECQKLRMQ